MTGFMVMTTGWDARNLKTYDEIIDLYQISIATDFETPDSYYWYGWLAFICDMPLTTHTSVAEWQEAYEMGWEDARGSKELEDSATK
jgi:hypothetical protein